MDVYYLQNTVPRTTHIQWIKTQWDPRELTQSESAHLISSVNHLPRPPKQHHHQIPNEIQN